MALVNCYATLAATATAIGIDAEEGDAPYPADTTAELEAAITAASRQIDDHCGPGRRFWADTNPTVRYYHPRCTDVVHIHDLSSTSGLVVAVDDGDDGTYAATLTVDVDFVLEPVNAAAESEPYTSIRLISRSFPSTRRAAVKVTGRFGRATVPDVVERACVMQARQIFKAPAATFGMFQVQIDGQPMRVPPMDPTARALLEGVVRYVEVDDHADD